MNTQEVNQEVPPFSDATLERLLTAIDEVYGIQLALVTPTHDGSSIADFPVTKVLRRGFSTLVGFPIKGDEFLYEIAARMERKHRHRVKVRQSRDCGEGGKNNGTRTATN